VGLADDYRFISLRIGKDWYSLPLMRQTRHKSLHACLTGKSKRFVDVDCRALQHSRSL
jgi:hypothetical protein